MAFSHGKAATAEDGQALLSTAEAAALLRPHMPHKNALAWLVNDRRHDPLIPFLVIGGSVRYRSADVAGFILRFLNPSARFVRLGQRHIPERRTRATRRSGPERRSSSGKYPKTAAERRLRGELDRRLRGELDRRGAR